jgi:predicted RNase H-like HicB family nuclease
MASAARRPEPATTVRPGSYSAYVPELSTILVVIGRSVEELTDRATEAIRLYWESVRTDRSPTAILREIAVELPA